MHKNKSIIVSAILGNILEYYDFGVYSVFALAIGRTFFPEKSEFLQIILSLTMFATGYLLRPLGGIFFGYIGDRYGRRTSLILSMLGMTIATLTIGLIPSYHTIGTLAPILLTCMRLIQGLCISGEGTSTAIFILEHHQYLKPGFTAGLVHGTGIFGGVIATCIGIIIGKNFPNIDYSWRFAFFLGGLTGLIGYFLRLKKVSETPIFKMLAEKNKTLKSPFTNVLKTAWRAMFVTCCVAGVASSILQLLKTINVFLQNTTHMNNTIALYYLFYTNCISMITMPLFGALTDYFGRFKMLTIISSTLFITALPSMLWLSSDIMWQRIISLILLSTLGGAISGIAYIFVISLFTPEQKITGVAFSYNLGITLFGSTSPIISNWLVKKTGLPYAPAFYIMATSGLFLITIWYMKNFIMKYIKE